MNDALVECISRQDATTFVRLAREQLQGRSLRDHASLLAARGKTTISEAMRVCNLLED
jgi:MSHA biogenesis protein MshE